MTSMNAHIKALLEDSRARRQAEVDALKGSLTEREQRLIREAFVLGFVARHRMTPEAIDFPKDSEIEFQGFSICVDHQDLYPTISGYETPLEE